MNDKDTRDGATASLSPTIRATLRRPSMWLSVALFFVYTGIEATAGAWAYSLLTEARGVARMTAGTWVSLYWGALTVGRIGAALFAHRSSAQRLLRGCIGGQAVGALLLWAKVAALSNFLGLVLIGLASAPIFPTLIATTPTRIGETHTANGVGVQIAAAVLGQSLLPALVGVLAQRCGLEVVAPALFGAALCLYGWHELLLRLSRPKTSQPYNAETETPASPPSLR